MKLENDRSEYPCGYKRQYHSETRDILSGEIFRRVEPQKRTMDEYFKQEVSPKFGGLDWYISLPDSELHRTFVKKFWSFWHHVINLCHSRKNGNIQGVGFCEFLGDMKKGAKVF